MLETQPEKLRKYGYDILINRFEPRLRIVLINEVLLKRFGAEKWIEGVPTGVIDSLKEDREEFDIKNSTIEEFFEETYLNGLKEIGVYSDNYKYLNDFVSNTGKEKFIEVMDELNELRQKIAHSKTFTQIDLLRLIDLIKTTFSGKLCAELISYIEQEGYKNSDNIPADFFSKYACQNNLPIEEYDLDGGFVGRRKEIQGIKKHLYSAQDRILSVTGAGGIGKTAVALKTAYSILADEKNPFDAIIWFSAKESRLTPEGIVGIESQIKGRTQFIKDIFRIVDPSAFGIFEKDKLPIENYVQHLNEVFSSQRCLLVIDNLETIHDQGTIDFIKDIPRPSQVLITSRKGLGEIERQYPLPDFETRSAIELFRLVAKEKNRVDLLRLDEKVIVGLVSKVKCYPLLIKWSIGKVCLGKEINSAFTEIYSGTTDIAKFVFDDIFGIFTSDAKLCLYSLVILGDKPASGQLLKHLSGLEDDRFDDAIRELTVASFVYSENEQEGGNPEAVTNYAMLSLTKGFIQAKLDLDKVTQINLENRYFELTKQVEQLEKSQKAYSQSLFSLGVKSDAQKIAFNYIKTAKNFSKIGDLQKAEHNFKEAIRMAPNFSYALIEYAKFEFFRSHVNQANDLFEQAIKADKENYHGFFTYGKCLRMQNSVPEAVKMLEKAKDLYPDYPPVYNELGRAYTYSGEYEKANRSFEIAKKPKGSINYKNMIIATQFQADNYRRWSEQFFERKDFETGMLKLNEALELITGLTAKRIGDKYIYTLEKDIKLNIAINLCKMGKFDDAMPYYEKCFESIRLNNGITITFDRVMAKAYYFIVYYGLELGKLDTERLEKYIKQGLAVNRDPKYIKKFFDLKKRVDGKKASPSDLKYGTIDWFNKYRHFGLIRSGSGALLFFPNSFKIRVLEDDLETMSGVKVSFHSTPNQKNKEGPDVATDVSFEY